jgi:MerR family redox-sensitive transcriptional activator SoxR
VSRDPDTLLTVGEVARRTGIATSALRFYEDQGLVSSTRNAAGHRRYTPDVIRRVSFVRVAQRVGLTLGEIREAIATLPDGRTPTRRDWGELASQWRPRLDAQIVMIERLRDGLDGCIGCGCLSLDTCALWNPDDIAGQSGFGARYLVSDERPVGMGPDAN